MAFQALFREVQAHLQEFLDDPSKGLNEKLLESVDGQVTGPSSASPSSYSKANFSQETILESDRDALLNKLSGLLPTLQQDPTPVTNLINRLVSPQRYTFSRVLTINPPVDFLAGLAAPSPPINLTTLCLLERAKFRPSDIAIVAGKADVVGVLVKLWLCAQDIAVAGRAHDVILGLLLPEAMVQGSIGLVEGGLMWRRILRDKDIYGSIFSMCSLSTAGQDRQPSKRDKTVAQARLLDMLLRIDSEPVRTSQIPEIERQYGVSDGGLLDFAAIHMVDYKDDVLMHVNLLEFYTMYLSTKYKTIPLNPITNGTKASTFALEFLRKHGLHDRSLSYFLYPDDKDPVDLTFLYGRSANYLGTWCSVCPKDFLGRPTMVKATLNRLMSALQIVSTGQWAQGWAPKDDLHVLVSLPRMTLLPRGQAPSPLVFVPVRPANEDALKTLAYVFNGSQDTISEMAGQENAAARALYYFYMANSPNFWRDVVSAAETVALKDTAMAALSVMAAVITAHWGSLPSTMTSNSPFALPTEGELANKCGAPSLPATGIETIMTEPAIGVVVPYLIKPAQTFSNLVDGGRGDVDSAAYKVAVAKHDTLIHLHEMLKQWVGIHPEAQEMLATVGRRVAQGPMGGSSEIGERIGTMEL